MADSEGFAEDWSSDSSSSSGDLVESDVGHEVGSSFVFGTIRFVLDLNNLSLIRAQYSISSEFELELSVSSS